MCLKSSVAVLIVLIGSVSCFPEGRVVNGTNSDITKYPFMVSIRRVTGSFICGSSIIAPHWILTAAHCVSGGVASQLTIQYATTNISPRGSNVVGVKRIIVHEDYDPYRYWKDDIALLELEGQLVYNYKTIAPVTLPDPYFEVPQTSEVPGILAGWGLNATGGVIQRHLQEVTVKIYSDEECQLRHNGKTSTDQICGGVDEGGKGQCSGDSGSPFLYQGSIQLGIASWSVKPCTIAPYPDVYTKVSHYIGWINKQIN